MFPGAPELSWFLDSAIKLGRRRGERVDAAVTAVGKALVETQLYLRDLARGIDRSQQKEDDIVRWWTAAAEALRHCDKDFAHWAAIKAKYWLEPDRWAQGDPAMREIGIERISSRYYDLQNVERPVLREAVPRPYDDLA